MPVTVTELKETLKKVIFNGNIPVCEAQLQYELAIELGKSYPKAKIYLEYPAVDKNSNKRIYYDLVIVENNTYYVIELKYKTKAENVSIYGVSYELKTHAAQDLGRFDYLKDISRIENFSANTNKNFGGGFAVIVTNDNVYWKNDGEGCLYKEFALNIGATISKGNKNWANGTKTSSVGEKRIKGLTLLKDYPVKWEPIADTSFQYLLLEIK